MLKIRILFTVILVTVLTISGCGSDEDKKTSHFQKGKAHFEQGEYKRAEIEFKNAIQIDPKYIEAFISLGDTYLKLGDLQGAFQVYYRLAERDQNNLDAQLKLANFYMLGKKVKESRNRVDLILSKDPDHIDALFLLAGIHESDNKIVESAAVYKKILTIENNSVRAYMGLSRIVMRQGNASEAESLLKRAISIDTSDLKPKLALFGLYAKINKYQEAENVIQETIRNNPEDSDLHIILGNFYFRRQMLDRAESTYKQAIEINPKKVKPYMVLASFYNTIGKKEEALGTYLKALETEPGDVRVLSTIARHYFKNKDIENARKYISMVLKSRPNYYPTRMLTGEIAIAEKDFTAAISIFDHLIQEEPRIAVSYYYKGLAHLGNAEINLAKAELVKAIEIDPKFLNARLRLGELYMNGNDFRLAQKESEEILKFRPDSYQATHLMGTALLYQRRPYKAENVFKKLVDLDSHNPVGYYRLGSLYRLMRKNDLAMRNLNKALSINPRYLDAFTEVIVIHVAQKELDLAIKKCDLKLKEIQDDPNLSAVVHTMQGGLYLENKKTAEAEPFLLAALEENPNYPKPYYLLSRIYLAEGNPQKSIEQFKILIGKNPEKVQPHMLLGTIYEQQKKFDLAEKHYRAALEISPDFAPAANNLAYMLSSRNLNIDEALALAKKAKEKLPTDPNVADTLGWLYYRKGLYDMAIGEFSDSLHKLPDNPEIHYHLGLALHKKGDMEGARASLERALNLNAKFDGADEARKLLEEI